MINISYSSISDFLRCPRYYFYRRVAKYVPVGAEGRATAFGNAFHSAQAVWWNGRHDDDPVVRLNAARDEWMNKSGALSVEDQILGEILLTGYAVKWEDSGLMFHMEPIVEERVHAPLLGPSGDPVEGLQVVAVFDVVAYDLDGNVVLIDHKTTTSQLDEGSSYWQRADLSLQVGMYYVAASDVGRTAGRFIWDAVRAPEYKMKRATPPEELQYYKRKGKFGNLGDLKPGQRLSDESPEEFAEFVTNLVLSNPESYYARHDQYQTPDQLDMVRADLYQVGMQIKIAHEGEYFPRNRGLSSCFAFNRPCPYLPVCNGETSITDTRLYQVRTRDTSFEEWK
jgi:hypothetical protein